jgi:WD40 repeat protein
LCVDFVDVAFVSAGRDSMINLWKENGDCASTMTAHRGTVNFLSEVSYDLQLKLNAPVNSPQTTPLMLSTGSDNVIKIWDLKRMRSASEIMMTSGSGLLTKAVWVGPSVVSCSNGGMVKLFQYCPVNADASGSDNAVIADMSGGAGYLSPSDPMMYGADDSSVTAVQAGKAEWRCKDLACHSQACTDLLSTSQYVAVSSKSGQIFKWNRC